MIEALVAYIEEQGFDVDVRPEKLLISKIVNGELGSFVWVILREDLALAQLGKEFWIRSADYHITQFYKAADERRQALSLRA